MKNSIHTFTTSCHAAGQNTGAEAVHGKGPEAVHGTGPEAVHGTGPEAVLGTGWLDVPSLATLDNQLLGGQREDSVGQAYSG
jgi:hypothetical protein